MLPRLVLLLLLAPAVASAAERYPLAPPPPSAPAPAVAPAVAPAPAVRPEPPRFNPAGLRDPFTPEVDSSSSAKAGSGLPLLQVVDLGSLRLSGVYLDGTSSRAMVLTPDGEPHFLAVGDRVGKRGRIASLHADRVTISEAYRDASGRSWHSTTTLKLTPEQGER